MQVTEQQIFDYIFCPTKYDIKYNRQIPIQDPISLPRLLRKVSKFFYLQLVNGKVPSINELKNKWDSVCKANSDFIDSKKNIAGWGLIIQLVDWARKEQIMVVDVDTQFKLISGPVEVTGQMETILIRKDRKSELLITNFADKIPDQIEMDMKLKHSLDAAAFKTITGNHLDGIRIRSVKHDKDILTTRSDPDFLRLDSTIQSVAKGIKNNIYYPREQNLCSSCTAKQYCRFWNNQSRGM